MNRPNNAASRVHTILDRAMRSTNGEKTAMEVWLLTFGVENGRSETAFEVARHLVALLDEINEVEAFMQASHKPPITGWGMAMTVARGALMVEALSGGWKSYFLALRDGPTLPVLLTWAYDMPDEGTLNVDNSQLAALRSTLIDLLAEIEQSDLPAAIRLRCRRAVMEMLSALDEVPRGNIQAIRRRVATIALELDDIGKAMPEGALRSDLSAAAAVFWRSVVQINDLFDLAGHVPTLIRAAKAVGLLTGGGQ